MAKALRLVEVFWEDACAETGWTAIADLNPNPLERCRTVGWLIRRTPHHTVLAATRDNRANVNGLWYIPTPSISRIRRIS